MNYNIDNYKVCYINYDKKIESLENEILNLIKNNDLKAIFIKFTKNLCFEIEMLIKNGFEFHHVQDEKLSMVKYIKKKDTIPKFCDHIIAGGGLILNELNEILLIKELNGNKNYWKIPGGRMDLGENIEQLIIREIKEEVNIDKFEFLGISFIRELRPFLYDSGDMYFCGVFFVNSKQNKIIKQESEIKDLKWFSIKDFLKMENKSVNHKQLQKICEFYLKNGKDKLNEKLLKSYEISINNNKSKGLIWTPFL